MRLLIVVAAIAALSVPAFAQQGRQQPQRPPAQAQPQQPQQQQAPEATDAAPGMFACRTETEICYIAVVTGRNNVAILYTNDPDAEGMEEPTVAVQGRGGPLALAQHLGRVVMLTGRYNRSTGLSNAELVDVASPLLSFAIKSMLSGEGEIEEEPPPAQPQQQAPRR